MLANTEGRGRKKIMNSITERRVIHQVKIDPKISAPKIAASTSNTLGRSISAESSSNYNGRVARKKPLIANMKVKSKGYCPRLNSYLVFIRKICCIAESKVSTEWVLDNEAGFIKGQMIPNVLEYSLNSSGAVSFFTTKLSCLVSSNQGLGNL
ncbi:hypothetical protein TNCT_517461 [Trichonephila clavata]|uniref:Uncharacterized protein n=1 Tax=Trichonephila clavata TaxID=2740835 RepID=A0A8X6HSH6_TRICU|nr:hypothetical protein TNCT_517461 [Trichonephila clavata]